LACFFAIAKGDLPARDWFRLGRAFTPMGGGAVLVSWSGSMFEYLMPSLVMRAPDGSLLEDTSEFVVRCQIGFGGSHDIPWGVSESAYNVRDVEYTYQYSNFGIPGLGLKRGLDADLVIAPYATALAAMVDPAAAVRNMARLARAGGGGRYGFYEALDYTPGRVPAGKAVAVVRAFMAHHQGMTVIAIADTLLNGLMRARFHAEPLIKAAELLLQERAPRHVAMARPLPIDAKPSAAKVMGPPGGRRYSGADEPEPVTHLLSNGRYAVMLTSAGAGSSRWGDLAVTRWREDPTLDDWGAWILLRDAESGKVWSAGLQPTGVAPDAYEVAFGEDRAEFARRDGTLTTMMEVLVSAEEDAEVRRISVTNAGTAARTIDITSYTELALIRAADDLAHPAFAKMFVQTERLADGSAILATRRRRTPAEPEIWAGHLVVAEDAIGDIAAETDRARFLGRGRTVRDAAAMDGAALSNTVGTVLDAVFSRFGQWWPIPGTPFSTPWISTATKLRSTAHRHWPGRRRRCNCATSRSARTRQICSSASPHTWCSPGRHCGQGPKPSSAATASRAGFGDRASPATCRSCSCGFVTAKTWTWPGRFYSPTNISA
jgi:cyclic beta-1,2-glucan synthetase